METQGHDISPRTCLRDAGFGKLEAIIARACRRDARMENFRETQGHDIARTCLQDAVWGTFGKFKAIVLPEHASEVLGWEGFETLRAVIWTPGMCLQDARFGKLLESRPRP